jgi:N-succinyldiaminopimelate aminotransferase
LSIGEPKHPTPALVKDALARRWTACRSIRAPPGLPELREAIAAWARGATAWPRWIP